MSRTITSGLAALAISGLGVVALAAPASAACTVTYSGARCIGAMDTQSTQTPRAGGSLTIDYSGLAPGSALTLTLDTGQGLGTFTVDANGLENATFTVPRDLSGPHTVTAKGTKADGSAVTFTTSFTVIADSSSGGAGSGSSGNLPFTGADTAAEGAAGLGLLAVGTLAVVVGRRRRTSVK